jgi:hypothetical protein
MAYDLEKEILKKKLELAETSLELGSLTRTKWEQMDELKVTMHKEELLIRNIALISKELDTLSHANSKVNGNGKPHSP